MTGADEDFQAKLKALRKAFRDSLDGRLDEIDAAHDKLLTADGGNSGELDNLQALAHKLNGAAGTFGLAAVSDAAGELEALCISLVEEGTAVSGELDRIAGLLDDLHEAAEKS
ncbi:MAG: Hpt domain-containing protein [Rhodospirillales bacterium]|nr:Hpt domain-containing protein [Rhodospirillales bacterium]